MKHHTATAHRRIVKLGPDSTLPLSPAMLAGLIHAKTATVGNCYRNWYGPLSDWYGRPPDWGLTSKGTRRGAARSKNVYKTRERSQRRKASNPGASE